MHQLLGPMRFDEIVHVIGMILRTNYTVTFLSGNSIAWRMHAGVSVASSFHLREFDKVKHDE